MDTKYLLDREAKDAGSLMQEFRGESSQVEVAELLGLDPSVVSRIESGKRRIPKKALRLMAKLLQEGYKPGGEDGRSKRAKKSLPRASTDDTEGQENQWSTDSENFER